MNPKPPQCGGCPANKASRGFVPFEGPEGAGTLIVGQGPGEREVQSGRPFYGPSGNKLDRWLWLAEIDRKEVRVGNVVLCQLPKNRAPTAREVAYCRKAHWEGELAGRERILAVGVPAITALLGRGNEMYAGSPERLADGTPMMGVLHPARILRGGWALDPVQIEYTKRFARREFDREPIHEPPPGAVLDPTLEDLARWEKELLALPDHTLTCDIENAGPHIRLIGFARVHDERAIVVPFRRQGGAVAGTYAEIRARAEWCQRVLQTYPVVMHNGQAHDVPHLEGVGFEQVNLVDDTILMQHVAYPELPRGLQFCATWYCKMPVWKGVEAAEDEDK